MLDFVRSVDKMKKPLRCKLWVHRWIHVGLVTYVLPSRGPFDPEPCRTEAREEYVCALCGLQKTKNPWEPSGCGPW